MRDAAGEMPSDRRWQRSEDSENEQSDKETRDKVTRASGQEAATTAKGKKQAPGAKVRKEQKEQTANQPTTTVFDSGKVGIRSMWRNYDQRNRQRD
jgi:hypothetical protein